MGDSSSDLNFSDYGEGKVIGTHKGDFAGNGLINKEAKEIVIPETYKGKRVIEVGQDSFYKTNIESIFISKYITKILRGAFHSCQYLKYVTFDENSKLTFLGAGCFDFTLISSFNFPSTFKEIEKNTHIEEPFYSTTLLTCVSYFGTSDIGFTYLFYNPGSLVAHTYEGYPYKIGTYVPLYDNLKCPEKKFIIKRHSKECTIIPRSHQNTYTSTLLIFFVLSS